jgi:hypothetical protein
MNYPGRTVLWLWIVSATASCKGAKSPSSAGGSGIPECDQYIALVRTCAAKQEKPEDRDLMLNNAAKMENDLRGAGFGTVADGDKDKEGMRTLCKESLRGDAPVIGWCETP